MLTYFCIRVEFLQGRFHGRGEGGEPEWPPSPLRLYQALVAAAAAHTNERAEVRTLAGLVRALEGREPPVILAPPVRLAEPYRLYVPNNAGDLVASSWASHKDASIAGHRTEKDVYPQVICEDVGGDAGLYYAWALEAQDPLDVVRLQPLVRAITHLGWGVDQVAAEAMVLSEDDLGRLPGERYSPTESRAGRRLPVPVPGTLRALTERHQAALGRIQRQGKDGKERIFYPVPRLTTLRWVHYAKAGDPRPRHVQAFAITNLNPESAARFRAYDPISETPTVVGMVRRHLCDADFQRRLGWPEDKLAALHGHGESGGEAHQAPEQRLAIIPVPSYEWRGDERGWTGGATRRVLVAMLKGADDMEMVNDVAHLLSGAELIREGQQAPDALLTAMAPDTLLKGYLEESSTWTTVTPLILPGFDDRDGERERLRRKDNQLDAAGKAALIQRLEARVEGLIRKAIRQAGYADELAEHARIECRSTGFLPGLALSGHYTVPEHLKRFRRLHVRLTWKDARQQEVKVPGPIVLGAGRFFGLGVFINPHARDR